MTWNTAILAILLSPQIGQADFDDHAFKLAMKTSQVVNAMRPHPASFTTNGQWDREKYLAYRWAQKQFQRPIWRWREERSRESDRRLRENIATMMSALESQ